MPNGKSDGNRDSYTEGRTEEIMNRISEEFDILERNVEEPIVLPFRKEITALVEAFGNSGQSGASAPFTAKAIAMAVENLCLHKPLYGLTLEDDEWLDQSSAMGGNETYQNIRLGSVFKDGKEGRAYYLDAIVFEDQHGFSFTSGGVQLVDGTTVGSAHYIKELPFKPKTFRVDVISTEWADKEETEQKVGGGWWTSVVRDEKQLEEVFAFYDRK